LLLSTAAVPWAGALATPATVSESLSASVSLLSTSIRTLFLGDVAATFSSTSAESGFATGAVPPSTNNVS
jgi:hypothetical protein